jgi:hypothetical protein
VAVAQDLDIKVGDTFWSPRWAVLVSGVPVDLTDGWTVRAQVRSRADSVTVLHEFTGDGVLVTAPTEGEDPDTTVPSTVQLYIPASEAAALTEWVGVWDLEIEHPTAGLGGVPYRKTVLSGLARTTWDVTRGS